MSLVDRRDAPYDEVRVRGGRDDRRGARGGWVKSREQSIGNAGQPGTCRGGKSGLQRVRWWVTPTVGAHVSVAPIGTVPQKIDRLEYAAIRDGFEVRVKR